MKEFVHRKRAVYQALIEGITDETFQKVCYDVIPVALQERSASTSPFKNIDDIF